MGSRFSHGSTLSQNRLLSALPQAEFERLHAHMDDEVFGVRDVVYRANGPIRHVYFPRSGMLSMVLVLKDGATSEAGVAGNEGMVGVPVFLGASKSPTQVICQHPCEAWRLPAEAFRDEVRRDGALRKIVQRYTLATLNQLGQTAACNNHHSVHKKLARWLLMTHDRAGADEFPITQEFLAMMVGSHRPSVTVTARMLQQEGLIRYSRGQIAVLDRPGLEAAACECYRVVRDEFDRILS
jgi:CRP-like cAMP-binding protein